MPDPPLILLVAAAVMALGSTAQASAGVGLGLLVVPILALLAPQFVPGPMLAASVALTAATAWRGREAIAWPMLASALVGLALGTVAGVAALGFVEGPNLPKVFGALVLLAVGLSLVGPKFAATRGSLFVGGSLSGLMGAMIGIHGPPISLVLQHETPARLRATLSVFFLAAGLGVVAALALAGRFGGLDLLRAAWLLPGVAVGLLVAPLIAPHLDARRLRFIVLGVAALSAVVLLAR